MSNRKLFIPQVDICGFKYFLKVLGTFVKHVQYEGLACNATTYESESELHEEISKIKNIPYPIEVYTLVGTNH